MVEHPGVRMPITGWCAIGPCPDCGAEPMRAVSVQDRETNFLCESCGACWFFTMGTLGRVDPFSALIAAESTPTAPTRYVP